MPNDNISVGTVVYSPSVKVDAKGNVTASVKTRTVVGVNQDGDVRKYVVKRDGFKPVLVGARRLHATPEGAKAKLRRQLASRIAKLANASKGAL